MTTEEINTVIAEACGWTRSDGPSLDGHPPSCEWTNPNGHYSFCPDYTSDLNAMHEAEQRLGAESKWPLFISHLNSIICGDSDEPLNQDATTIWCMIHATARQRAEAFLRTIGKWKDDERSQQQAFIKGVTEGD